MGRRSTSVNAMEMARVCFSIFLVGWLFAQETTIKTAVRLVVIPVSVTDERGRFIYDLNPADFTILDNGKPQEARIDPPDVVTAPLRLVVLIQTSDISDSALLKIKKVGTMVEDAVVGANGSVAVITFADEVNVERPFAGGEGSVSKTFRQLRSVKTRKARMLDAIAKGLSLLAGDSTGANRVLLIIGESKDRGSKTKLQDLVPIIQRSGVTIYSLAYSAYLTPLTTKASDYSPPEGGNGWILDSVAEVAHAAKQNTCKMLVAATGGEQFKFERLSKLENDLIRLGGIVHSRYMVSFTPRAQTEPGFHEVSIQIVGRPQLHVSARPGYWAVTDSAASGR